MKRFAMVAQSICVGICLTFGLGCRNSSDDSLAIAGLLALTGLPGSSTAGATCSPALKGGTMQGCALSLSNSVTTPFGPSQGTTTAGDTDGTGNAARFSTPYAATTDGSNLYIADFANNKIRKIVIATGVVTTLAGPTQGATTAGDTDGTGNTARFSGPNGITNDGTNLYVTEAFNNKIRQVTISTGAVTTMAGPAPGATTSGDTDATGNAARFGSPNGITTDGTNLYVSEAGNKKIRKVDIATGVVTTLAGPAQGATTSGDTDATGNAARFNFPRGITTDGTNLYVADTTNNKIRKIVIATALVTTIGGPAPGAVTSGDTDATGTAARFNLPIGVTTDGTNLYIADTFNNKVRRMVLATGVVTTMAGPAQGSTSSGDTDGTGNAALIGAPTGITSDATSVFVTTGTGFHKIRRIQ